MLKTGSVEAASPLLPSAASVLLAPCGAHELLLMATVGRRGVEVVNQIKGEGEMAREMEMAQA